MFRSQAERSSSLRGSRGRTASVFRAAPIPGRIVALAAGADTVYAATARPLGRLLRLPARGGAAVPMADVPEGIGSIALGPAHLFATTDAAPGKLLAVSR